MDRRLLALGLVALLAGCGGGHKAATTTAPPVVSTAGTSVSVPPPPALTMWSVTSDNVTAVPVTVTATGAPVAGVQLRVDGFALAPTDSAGRTVYTVDSTRLARHVVTGAAPAAITVAYPISGLGAARDSAGNPTVSGRISYVDGSAPPVVSRYSYELTGTVTDSNGHPVEGARVSTRTADRDYWTVSGPTDAQGRYSSLFTASSEQGGNPVPFTVRVSEGDIVYEFLQNEVVDFRRLQSARMNLRLPPHGFPMALPLPLSYPGAVFEGIVVGAAVDGKPVRPLRATWPDLTGHFRLTLPRSLAGRTVTLWEAKLDLFSLAVAVPGGPIDLRDWPAVLPVNAPRDLARIRLR